MNLKGRKVMLTGAGGGIATSIAQTLLARGADLILVGRQAKKAQAELGTGTAVHADLESAEGAAELRKHSTGVSALVHTVGGFSKQCAWEVTEQDLQKMFALNLGSFIYVVEAILPELRRQEKGHILGISAGQVIRGDGKGSALYVASKAALASYIRALNLELEANLCASVIYPMGTVDTPANRTSMPDADFASWIDPLEVSLGVSYLLESSNARELMIYPPKP